MMKLIKQQIFSKELLFSQSMEVLLRQVNKPVVHMQITHNSLMQHKEPGMSIPIFAVNSNTNDHILDHTQSVSNT